MPNILCVHVCAETICVHLILTTKEEHPIVASLWMMKLQLREVGLPQVLG